MEEGKRMRTLTTAEVSHIYQPMWSIVGWEVFGYEALMRIKDRSNVEIEGVFSKARAEGCLFELDSISVESAISHFPMRMLNQELLFINIFPSTIIDERFETFIKHLIDKYSLNPRKIVFELNETIEEELIWGTSVFKERIAALREGGFKIALDDIGKGAATILKIIEHSPDYIKLDRYFSENLSTSKEKQEMIALLLNYTKQKMGLILEGIEREVDLAYARMINVPVVQGYLLGRPQKMDDHLGITKKVLNF
jgi:EAL domain-containing protein (putative c-di-GMP-specific phosphodiesterase class I)